MVEIMAMISMTALILFFFFILFKLPFKSYEATPYLTILAFLAILSITLFILSASENIVNEYRATRQSIEEKGITVNIRQDGMWKEENYNFGN